MKRDELVQRYLELTAESSALAARLAELADLRAEVLHRIHLHDLARGHATYQDLGREVGLTSARVGELCRRAQDLMAGRLERGTRSH